MAERITHTDLLAMVVAVYIYVKLRYTPGQRYLHSLPQLLEAFAAQLLRRSPHARQHSKMNISSNRSTPREFSQQQQLG